MSRRNSAAGIVLLVFAFGYGYQTSRLPTRTLPNTPDPSFFPWLLTAALLILATALLVQGLRTTQASSSVSERRFLLYPASALAVFFVYLLALPLLGFVAASIPFFTLLMLLAGERRLRWLLPTAICIPLGLYLLFNQVFQIPLPRADFF